MDDHPEIRVEGDTPSSPWNDIADAVSLKRGRRPGAITISGADFFGLLSPVICHLIQQMDGAAKCVNYVMRRFEPPMPQI
jgi:hypothetical protein